MKFIKFFLIAILAVFLNAAPTYDEEAVFIKEKFAECLNEYKNGNNDRARELTQEAYFSHFENLEAGIRINLGQKKAYAMEKKFGDIRKAIKAQKPAEQIEAIINKLNGEISEILPVIKSGKKLVAQKSDDGGLKAAGITQNSENLAEISAENLNNPWNALYENIVKELEIAKQAHAKGDKEGIINALNKVKFDFYRNQKLEIAIRQYNSQNLDQMIQQILGSAIAKNTDLSESGFETHAKDIDDLIKTAIAKLPEKSYALAPEILSENSEEVAEFTDFSPTIENIKTKMAEVLALYESGEIKKAVSVAQDIYFDEYEASGMELKVGTIDNDMKLATEASFSAIASLVQSKAGVEKIKAAQEKLFSQLEQSLEKIGASSSPISLFIFALTIILREGFEALIIVAAVVAYLIKTGNSQKLSIVYSSLSLAIVLSFVTAWVVNLLFTNAAQSREILEGVTILIAVGLLFYVGFWLLSNANSKKWSEYIKSNVSESLSKGDKMALWWTVFLAVYREGAEIVLFYQALIFDAQKIGALDMIAYGFLVGTIILAVTFMVFKIFSIKIPIRPFFLITSIIIFYMSIVFVGKGVMELVEGKVFVPETISGIPTIPWLGIYPYLESLVPQILMLIALFAGILIMKKREKLNLIKENR